MRDDLAKYINIFDYVNIEELRLELEQSNKLSGTCIFVDLCGSTKIKYEKSYAEWVIILGNTFNKICDEHKLEKNIIKYIGDEVMIFIPDEDLKKGITVNNYISLLYSLYEIIRDVKSYNDFMLNCKASIHYCTDVFHISFNKNTNDYYIDLTARLMSISKENRIVLSNKYFTQMEKVNLSEMKNYAFIKNISGKSTKDFRGVPSLTEYRSIDI